MKSDVVVDRWWNHELMFELLLDCVVDASKCFGYWYIWSYDQGVVVLLNFEKMGHDGELWFLIIWGELMM